jgi:xylulokinase
MSKVLIGVDIGTTGCKTVALDEHGDLVATNMIEYPLYSEKPGWSEQDPHDWWAAAKTGVSGIVKALGDASVVGIGLSGQMHGLVALDSAGEPLRRAILWNDQRCSQECDDITSELGGLDSLISLTNNRMLPGFTGGKLRWVRDHQPSVFPKLASVCLPKDYIRFRLTGVLATDESDASGTGYFDPRTRTWVPEVFEACGGTVSMLPQVFGSSEKTGALLDSVAEELGLPPGIPVYGGGGDAVIQTTSMGILALGDVGVTLGTAGIVAATADFCPENLEARVQISAGNSATAWHIMGVSLAAAGAFQWLGEMVAQFAEAAQPDFVKLSALAEAAPIGSAGLLFLPYLNGERSPHIAPDARGAFVGLTRAHKAEHLARSVIEGVVLNLRRILEELERMGVPCRRIVASGGASRSPLWLQILADVCDREVVTLEGSGEGGALGAALAAGVGAGVWEDYQSFFAGVKETARFEPDLNSASRYKDVYEVHMNLYEQLRAVDKGVNSLEPAEIEST